MEKKDTVAKPTAKVMTYTEETKEQAGFVVYHSFEEAELSAFIEFINDVMKDDPEIKPMLPLTNEESLIKASNDGMLLCKLINAAVPGTIDPRTINKKQPLNVYHKTENLRLSINAAKAVGCHIINITPQAILEGKLYLIMGMVWQILRIYLFKEINLKKVPEIIVLAEPNETLEDVMKLPTERIIVRWLNYHLKAAKSSIVVKEIGPELKDCIALITVLTQLDPSIDKSILAETNPQKRAEAIIKGAQGLGVKSFIHAGSLVQGNAKIYLIFCCLLFNARHGLEISVEKKKEVEKAALLDDAKTGTKEERTYKLWINSLGLENVYVNDIYEDLKDGLILLKILNMIWPGSVENGKYEKNPGTNRFKRIANGNYITEILKKQKLVLTGIGGMDIVDAKQTQLLGIIWQVMRAHYMKIIGGKADEEIVAWINKMAKPPGIKNFKDPVLKTARTFIDVMAKIEPDIIDWTLIKEGKDDTEIEMNAKYCISIARKLGATIFLAWDDFKMAFYLFYLFSIG